MDALTKEALMSDEDYQDRLELIREICERKNDDDEFHLYELDYD